jgi:tRNA (cytidine/uridine-2'-O-)-methyltransferase
VLDVVIVEPQIAPNTGAIVRLCANVGARLHLVGPLGFTLDDAALRRGGLDYHELSDTQTWESWAACRAGIGTERRWFATTASASRRYDTIEFRITDVVVFGRESDGLPPAVLDDIAPDHQLMIPMRAGNRSINLANAVSIVVYEAWRQHDFAGSATGTFAESRPVRPPGT